MAVSVPKRLFKKAVDRNLLKRRIREAYRLQKPALYSMVSGDKDRKLHLVIQYQQRDISDYHIIEKALFKGLDKLLVQLKEGRSFSADNGSASQSD